MVSGSYWGWITGKYTQAALKEKPGSWEMSLPESDSIFSESLPIKKTSATIPP